MADAQTTLETLKAAMAAFVHERDWEQFHNPKSLSMGVAVEAAELMEHFLWVDNETSRNVAATPEKREAIADEIADVGCYLLALSNVLAIDLSEAVLRKLAKNAIKYPAQKYRGRYQLEATAPQSG